MKKLLIALAFVVVACKKSHDTSPPPAPSIVGKWNINSVTVIPFDSLDNAINGGTAYTEPSYYYFQFNANNSWLENLAPDPSSGISESGNYELHGDSSFTLINTNAPSKAVECEIDTLTNTRFVFTYKRSTSYNGITPGYLHYIFRLQK